ncbi:MAG: substrate-binding domain-containing protein [Polyangiales bacterium]
MKTIHAAISAVVLGSSLVASVSAQTSAPAQLRGSDTLFGVVTQAIGVLGLDTELTYTGGGSGLGETGLRSGTQGIAPMSRALSAAGLQDLQGQGVTPVQHVIGLDGVAVFVKRSEALAQIDLSTLRAIFACEITDWSAVPGAGKRGAIAVYRRNDASGTTDTFKTLVGVSTFGACATVLESTADLATVTSTNASAIGYSGLSGERADNKAIAVGAAAAGPFVAPSATTIRNFSYPLSRRLYVNAVSGARVPSEAEQLLLGELTNRSFLDPILTANEFVTCLPAAQGGCP